MLKILSIIFFILIIFLSTGCSKDPVIPNGKLSVDNSLFQYTAEGEGIPCIVFTGSENLGPRMYSENMKQHLKMIHADPVNFSSNDITEFSIELLVDEIEKVRLQLGLEKIAVMSHSAFGLLSLEYALKYPDNVYFSIISGSAPFGFTKKFLEEFKNYWENSASAERKKIWQDNIDELNADTLKTYSESEYFIKKYIADIPKRFYDPEYNMEEIWTGIELNMEFANSLFSKLYNYDNSIKYSKIKTPVLILAGKYDFGSPYYLWNDYIQNFHNLNFHLFENAGHNPMLEQREKFDKIVIEWIKKH